MINEILSVMGAELSSKWIVEVVDDPFTKEIISIQIRNRDTIDLPFDIKEKLSIFGTLFGGQHDDEDTGIHYGYTIIPVYELLKKAEMMDFVYKHQTGLTQF